MQGIHMAVEKVGELGKPGSPGHAVEYEARMSRRQVFRFVVPFLVASIGIGVEKENDRVHEMAPDNE